MAKSLLQSFARWRAQKRLARAARGDIRARRKGNDGSLHSFLIQSRIVGAMLLALLWLFCVGIFYLHKPRSIDVKFIMGERSPRTVFTEFAFSYEDKVATDQARETAADHATTHLRFVPDSSERIQRRFYQLLSDVSARAGAVRDQKSFSADGGPISELVEKLSPAQLKLLATVTTNETALKALEQEFNTALSSGIIGRLLTIKVRNGHSIRITDQLGRVGLARPYDKCLTPSAVAALLAENAAKYHSNPDEVPTQEIAAVFATAIGPEGNLEVDLSRTDKSRQAARKEVRPVRIDVPKNTVLIARDAVVDAALLQRLSAYERINSQRLDDTEKWHTLFHESFLVLILIFIGGLYLVNINPTAAFDNRNLALTVGSIMLGLALIFYGMKGFYFFSEHFPIPPELATSVMSLALTSVLLAVTLGYRVAFGAGLFVSAVAAVLANYSFELAIKGLIVCSVTSLAVRHATNYRSFFVRTLVSLFPTIWLMDFSLLGHMGHPGKLFLYSAMLASLNALSTAIIALILIFLLELLFNVSTNMSLMVLCDYNHPLLERLKREAPGTFFHSLTVATLAEDAAKAIGANPLRAKAGALFHDIGKLFKPQYFTENNIGADNRHRDLTPQVSSIIIRDHVKEGLELAREYHLCRAVRDAIEQHHGNDLVHFFYQQALARNIPITESQYRYQGELPRAPEVVIVGLADACEAAARSLQKPSASKIESLVCEIFRKREHDGQLDAAEITLAQLAAVRASFINTLICMKHGRIAYNQENLSDENDLFMARNRTAEAAHGGGKEAGETRT